MARPREDISEELRRRQKAGSYQPGEAPQAEEPGGAGSLPPEENRFLDDPAPDDAMPEDLSGGARSKPPSGSEENLFENQDLSITGEDRIGAGRGLDEAEMGRARPLDGKRWDDDPKKPYGTD